MANKIVLKKSSVPAKAPTTSDLDYGELALNYADGKLFYKNPLGAIAFFTSDLSSFVTLAGSETLSNKTLSSPTITGNITGDVASSGILKSLNSIGDEGGEIQLSKPQTNTSIAGTGVTIDVYQNKLRIFEQGGSSRGVYIDLTAAGNSVSTNLLGGGVAGVTSVGGNTGDVTATQLLTSIKTVDGSGSGLDADLLDGQHGSYYLDWTNVTNKPDPVITLAGDLTGSVTLTDLASGTLTATIAANSVALGTDTTGNYLATLASSGNTITVTGSGSESAAVNIDLPNSGVTTGSYGSSTAIPVISIDAQGRITSASTAAISSSLSIAGDTGADTVTVGTDTLTITGGNAIDTTVTNNVITIDHADTSSVANLSSDNAGNTFIQDISLTFDTYGHVTGASVATGTVTVGDGALTLATSGVGLSGSASFTANQSTGSTFTVTSNATSSNTASTIVARDASGNFTAGTITATLSGNASTVTNGVYTNGSYADPAWITSLAKSKVGLGNVENTALSTWAGSTNITTIGAATASSLTVTGDLTVNGSVTTINSTTISVDDKNIELGSVTTPTNTTADGGGITLKGATDKTFNWVNATGAWTSSEHLALAAGKDIILNGLTSGAVTLIVPDAAGTTTITLPATTGTVITTGDTGTVTNTMLAGSIANAKLTNSSITVNGTAISLGGSGTVTATATNALTIGSYLTGTSYNGSAAVTIAVDATNLNTASKVVARDASGNFSAGTITAALTGNASTATTLATSRNINGVAFNGSADITITAANPNALTIGTGLSGTSYNGSSAVTIALASGYGDTQNPYASKTANYFLAAPNGTAGAPTFRAIVAADIPTLNQNTTGSAATLTTARTLTIGSTGKTFNGSADVSWSLAEIGASPTAGSTNITTLGTVGTGTWNATTIGTNKGGTGLTSFTANGAVYATSTSALTTGTLPVASGGTGVTTSTGSGSNVLSTSPTLVTPVIGAATGTSLTLTVATGTAPLTVSSTTTVSNLSADMLDGLHLHTGRNNEANKVVRTDGSGYIQAGYINSTSGNENNASNPPRVWGTNGSDDYMRTYQTTSLVSGYSNNYTQGFNSNWNTDFAAAPAGSTILRGDTSTGSSTGGPGGTWWFQQNMRHANASNVWGVQVAWGWEDNANVLKTRNVTGGTYGSWVTYLHSGNWSSYVSGGATLSDDTSTNASRYIAFASATSGSWATAYVSSTKLYFNPSTGTLNATVFNSLSDETKKTSITPIKNAVATVNQIDGFEFDWLEGGDHSAGVIAQKLEKILPFLVKTSETGEKSVNYSGLIAYLIESVKELSTEVEQLKQQLNK